MGMPRGEQWVVSASQDRCWRWIMAARAVTVK